MVYCSNCVMENDSTNTFCNKCGNTLLKEEYFNIKTYHEFNQLISPANSEIIGKFTLSTDAYNTIISNIKDQGKYNYEKILKEIPQTKLEHMDILSKISLVTLAFANISYKSRGAELGSYSFNLINIDDRLDKANQISALIHELTHHIVAEIFEQALMYLLEIKKSDTLEAFAWFTLANTSTSMLMDEYCAHTVQGRFIPHGYQNYGSFNLLLGENFNPKKKEDREIVHTQLVLGNSIAEDIIGLLEQFITPQMREEIKEQYKKDFNYPPKYDEIILETSEIMPNQVKASMINLMLNASFEFALANIDDGRFNEILNAYKKEFFLTKQTFRRDIDGFI